MSDSINWPTEADSQHLIANLLTGDRTASEEFAAAFLRPLTQLLMRKFYPAPEEVCATAAADALMTFIRQPERYAPSRRSLRGYLLMLADGDRKNAWWSESRHTLGKIPLDSVAEPVAPGNTDEDGDRPSWDDPRLLAAVADLDPPDNATFELLRAGERRMSVFVEALGLSDLPSEESEREVKRSKDRVKKRLTRAVEDDQ